jgi:hypothetical protein
MKKRGFFFVLVLALCSITFAETQQYTDLGTAQSLEVTEEKLSDAQANTASTVTVIHRGGNQGIQRRIHGGSRQ